MIDKLAILILRNQGLKLEEIASRLGCSKTYVCKTIVRCRVDPTYVNRKREFAPRQPKPKQPGVRRARVIELSRKYQESLNVS